MGHRYASSLAEAAFNGKLPVEDEQATIPAVRYCGAWLETVHREPMSVSPHATQEHQVVFVEDLDTRKLHESLKLHVGSRHDSGKERRAPGPLGGTHGGAARVRIREFRHRNDIPAVVNAGAVGVEH